MISNDYYYSLFINLIFVKGNNEFEDDAMPSD